jgi:hypothetical protein
MKLKTKHGISTIAFLGCFAAAGAGAQEVAGSQGGVPFLSGGVGEDSVTQMQARARDFNLKLLFTLVEGNYLADVGVTIRDSGGKTLVEQVSNGPFFLATLPPGSYTVAATHDGKTQTRKINIGGKGQHSEHFRWPSTSADNPTLSEARK